MLSKTKKRVIVITYTITAHIIMGLLLWLLRHRIVSKWYAPHLSEYNCTTLSRGSVNHISTETIFFQTEGFYRAYWPAHFNGNHNTTLVTYWVTNRAQIDKYLHMEGRTTCWGPPNDNDEVYLDNPAMDQNPMRIQELRISLVIAGMVMYFLFAVILMFVIFGLIVADHRVHEPVYGMVG